MDDMSIFNYFKIVTPLTGFFLPPFCIVYRKNEWERPLLWKCNVQSVSYFEKFLAMLFKRQKGVLYVLSRYVWTDSPPEKQKKSQSSPLLFWAIIKLFFSIYVNPWCLTHIDNPQSFIEQEDFPFPSNRPTYIVMVCL